MFRNKLYHELLASKLDFPPLAGVRLVQPCVGVLGLKYQIQHQIPLSINLPTKRKGNIQEKV